MDRLGGFGRGCCSPSARGITIHDFITILCHVGFSSCLSITANLSQTNSLAFQGNKI